MNPSKFSNAPAAAARWEMRPQNDDAAQRIVRERHVAPLMARILAARGVAPDCVESFLAAPLAALHNPFDMDGMEAAVARIGCAIAARQPICVYGDYDVDGVTSVVALQETILELGGQVEYYIPHRLSQGYGLSVGAVEQLAEEGVGLIVSVDCGITAFEAAARAKELGVDLVVTDHHEPGDRDPAACAVLNPKRAACSYPFRDLAGVGVAFKLAHALLKRLHPDPVRAKTFLMGLLDLVALGSVADIVPMRGENRSLVAHGLAALRRTRRLGLIHLAESARVALHRMDAGDISFGLAPRINAAGRTEHAMHSVDLLATDDRKRAKELAARLDELNRRRRRIEQETFDEAVALIESGDADQAASDDDVLVVVHDQWHLGVLGIVASRLMRHFGRPAFVLTLNEGVARGSGRSLEGFDLHAALEHCREHLVQFGGHPMAAGLLIEPGRVGAFRHAVNEHARVATDGPMVPLIVTDTHAGPDDLTRSVVESLDALAPHGQGNPKPVVELIDYRLIDTPQIVGTRHLKMRLTGPDGSPLTALGWGMGNRIGELADVSGPLRLVGTPFLNHYNGRTTAEIEIKDFRTNGAAPTPKQ